ncbi:CopD family protein [uncultured Litoreibacter sp.]|uniref:CopD family protein n=1 Tax=uncultured Litoreibacter sp. TaxID=1392394 RepID=UPI0026065C65|nr:CopD family protein [uncultured Litoreibacter sp.]
MIYEALKAAHIIFMVVWMSGMMLLAWLLSHPATDTAAALRRYDRMVTAPAMALTWLCGVGLAVYASWFGVGWLWGKLILVVVLSALHGVLSGRLRRSLLVDGAAPQPLKLEYLALVIALLGAVIFLVVTKPF